MLIYLSLTEAESVEIVGSVSSAMSASTRCKRHGFVALATEAKLVFDEMASWVCIARLTHP
jgi:hypothetical protein